MFIRWESLCRVFKCVFITQAGGYCNPFDLFYEHTVGTGEKDITHLTNYSLYNIAVRLVPPTVFRLCAKFDGGEQNHGKRQTILHHCIPNIYAYGCVNCNIFCIYFPHRRQTLKKNACGPFISYLKKWALF